MYNKEDLKVGSTLWRLYNALGVIEEVFVKDIYYSEGDLIVKFSTGKHFGKCESGEDLVPVRGYPSYLSKFKWDDELEKELYSTLEEAEEDLTKYMEWWEEEKKKYPMTVEVDNIISEFVLRNVRR